MDCCQQPCKDGFKDAFNMNLPVFQGGKVTLEEFQKLEIQTKSLKDKYDRFYRNAGYPFFTIPIEKFILDLADLETEWSLI
jgi:hypothetical protein